jgi:hypothetical protein
MDDIKDLFKDEEMVIIQRKPKPVKSLSKQFHLNFTIMMFMIAGYWLTLYRTTWLLDWAFLAMCATLIISVTTSFSLLTRFKKLRREADSLPILEIVIAVTAILGTSLLHFRTLAT